MSALLMSFAMLCWPSTGGLARLSGGRRWAFAGGLRSTAPPWVVMASVVFSAVVGWLFGGLLVGISATLVTGTAVGLVRSESRSRRDQRDLASMLAATRTLSREVRLGAGPAAAIRASAEVHPGAPAGMLDALAAAVAVDRGRPTFSGRSADGVNGANGAVKADRGLAAEIAGRLTDALAMSARYGVPLAALMETVSIDLADRVQARSQRAAQVSGPRVSSYVLALMPALGVLLGTGMGANPIHVLLNTGAGNLLLLVGCLLTCAGLAWTARIVRG